MLNPNWHKQNFDRDLDVWRRIETSGPDHYSYNISNIDDLLRKYFVSKKSSSSLSPNYSINQRFSILKKTMDELEMAIPEYEIKKEQEWNENRDAEEDLGARLTREDEMKRDAFVDYVIELKRLYSTDQALRNEYKYNYLDKYKSWEEAAQNWIRDKGISDPSDIFKDAPRLEKAKEIIKDNIGEIIEDKNSIETAWLLVQHMDKNVEFQKWFLKYLKEGSQQYKHLYDRITVNENKPQKYQTASIIISQLESSKIDIGRFWINDYGEIFPVDRDIHHGEWIINKTDILDDGEKVLAEKYKSNIPFFMSILFADGWIRISGFVAEMQSEFEMPKLAAFLSEKLFETEKDQSISVVYDKDDSIKTMKISDIIDKYGDSDELEMVISSRAVEDTIKYWDKAKSKDFSKYWRKLRKRKKKASNPLRQNLDYSNELNGPEWQSRVKTYRKLIQKKVDHGK